MTVAQLMALLSNHPPMATVEVRVEDHGMPHIYQRAVAGVAVSGRIILVTTHDD